MIRLNCDMCHGVELGLWVKDRSGFLTGSEIGLGKSFGPAAVVPQGPTFRTLNHSPQH